MVRTVQFILIALAMLATGCANRNAMPIDDAPGADRVILFVPGVTGDGPWYDAAYHELTQIAPVEMFHWGAPKLLFIANFRDKQIHDRAEQRLAERIDALPASVERVQIVAHSAGCGVALGATAQAKRRIDRLILIAPSVSPTYDLRPAMSRLDGPVHVFYSKDDVLLLKWRTSTFGTYDRVKTPAAGHVSFTPDALPLPDRARLIQHAYDDLSPTTQPTRGGHFACLAQPLFRAAILPLLR